MEELDLSNILEADEIEDLFQDQEIEETQPDKEGKEKERHIHVIFDGIGISALCR